MAKITLTRMYSGASNVPDTYRIGDFEHEGDAASGEYNLPDGYRYLDYEIVDPAGYVCFIEATDKGPRLLSLAGPVQDTPTMERAN